MSVFDGNYGGYRPMYNPFQYQVQPAPQYQNPYLTQQNNFQNQYQQTPQTQQPPQQTGMSAPTMLPRLQCSSSIWLLCLVLRTSFRTPMAVDAIKILAARDKEVGS